MQRSEYRSDFFKVTYTVEEKAPHPTIPHGYYNDTHAITIIIKGEGNCSVEGNVYNLGGGDIILVSADEICCFKICSAGYHERISLYFTNSLLLPFVDYALPLMKLFTNRPLGTANKYSFTLHDTERAKMLVEQIRIHAQQSVEPINTAKLHLLIIEFLFWIYECGESGGSHETQSATDYTVFRICEYIKNNLKNPLTYEELIQNLNITRYQLTDVFVRNMGITVNEYITRKRMSRAISLVGGGSGIETAAYEAGFNTYSYFYKKFLKHYKVSPREFFKSNL